MLEGIELGLDLATAVSVIGASSAFIWNLRKENSEKAKDLQTKLRIEQTIKVVNDLLEIQKKGVQLINTVNDQLAGIKVEKEVNGIDFLVFCREFGQYISYNSEVLLIPVARPKEKKILEELRELMFSWHDNIQSALAGEAEVPQFSKLLAIIADKLNELMESVKSRD